MTNLRALIASIIVVAALCTIPLLVQAEPQQASQEKASNKLESFNMDGIDIKYPGSWKIFPRSDIYLCHLDFFIGKMWTGIFVRLYPKECESPEKAFQWDSAWWKDHSYVVLSHKKGSVGARHEYPAEVVDVRNLGDLNADFYERHMYFGFPHRAYKLQITYVKPVADAALPELDKVAATVRLSTK